jgi:hypothetical protein
VPKRLAEIEAEREAELRKAEQWAAQNGGGTTPGRRSETGETDSPQPVRRAKGKPGFTPDGELPREHRDHESYSQYGLEQFEDALIESGQSYNPLISKSFPGIGLVDRRDLAKHNKVHHCLSFLTEARVNLLMRRHVEKMTLDAIAKEEGVTKRAIVKRLNVAEKHLRDAIAEHWDDDVTWEV